MKIKEGVFRLKNTFDEVAEKIEEENKLEKLLEIKSEKELYDFFKDNGYSKSEGEFKADIEKLIAESSIDLKNSDLSEVAGGAIKKDLKKLTSAGMASLLALGASPISSKAHASDVYHFTEFQPTSIQKSSQKGGSKAKKIILTMLGLSGATAITGLGLLGIDQLYKKREIAGRIEKVKELKEELNEMKKTAESYSSDFCSRIEECSDKLESLEKKPSSLSESEFETVQKMVEGVKKDFQDAKDKRAQEEKQAKAKAEAEQKAKEEEKRKLEEQLKAREKVKKEAERQKALEIERKQKQIIDKLKVEIKRMKEILERYQELNSNSGEYFDRDVASYLEDKIEILGNLKDNIDFSNVYEALEQVSEIENKHDELRLIVDGARYDIVSDGFRNTLDRVDGQVSFLEGKFGYDSMLSTRQEIQEIQRMFEEYDFLRRRNYSELQDGAEAELGKRFALIKDISLHLDMLNYFIDGMLHVLEDERST